jgi:NAD(P)-dependent dehydrogenase (short-subunit alcohol dehydrogenase family)
MSTVIITGANGNLGSAVTAEFLNKGYRVVATVIAESMRNDLAAHPALDIQVVDLGVEEQSTAFVASVIKKYEVVDAGLLLVGGFAMGNMAATGMTDIRKQFELNFATAYQVARPLFEHMMNNKKGRLVFIGARPALDATYGKDLVAYGLSKSLLFKLAEYLNEAGRGFNVTATVVAPSTLDTPLNRKSMPDVDPAIWVKPSALAEILEFIVSDKAHPLRETVLKIYNNA